MNDYLFTMEVLYIILGVLFIPTTLLILIEYIVERLPEDHKFVMWWRENVIGITDDELF